MLLEFFLDLILLQLDAEFRLSACTCQSAQHQMKAGGIFNCNEGKEFQQNSDPHCAERITHFYSCQPQKCYNLMFRSKEFCHRPNCTSFISSDLFYLDRYYHSIQFLKYCNLYKLVNMQILEVSREIFVNPKSQCFYSFFVGTQ